MKERGGRLAEGFGAFFRILMSLLVLVVFPLDYFPVLRALRRSSGFNSRFRMRRLLGVVSTSSSGPIYCKANSSVMSRGGVRIKASSEPDARILVKCFSLQTFTSKS